MIDRVSGKALLLIAIIAQLIHRILYFSIGEDISTQLHATVNFANRKGIVINEVLANDLGTNVSKLLSDWPVGYTLLLTPIYKVLNNIMWSAMILDGIFLSLFIFLIYQLLNFTNVNEKGIKLAMLFFAISATPYIYTTRTGVIAISFLLIGIIYLLKISKSESTNTLSGVICGTLFSLPLFFRYSYTPFVAIPVLFFIVKWLLSKDNQFIKVGLLSVVSTIVVVLGINYFQSYLVGERTYLADSKGFGFYFSNLIYFKEFLFKGLFYVDPIIDLGNENVAIKLIFKLLGLLLSTLVLIKLLVTVVKDRFSNKSDFEIIAVLTIMLNISMLLFLSLKYSNFHLTTYSWTFVQETRYFLPSIILLIIFMFKFYQENWIQKILNLAIGYAAILLVAGILKMFISGPSDKFYSNHHKDLQIIKTQLATINEPLVFSTQTNEIALRNLIAIEGYSIFNSEVIKNLEENNFKTNSPVTLITKLTKEDYLEYQEKLRNFGSQMFFENDQFILVKTQLPFG